MNYNYYAKQDYYSYLSGGVQAWDLLLPNNIGLKKGDTVTVVETYDNGVETGKATTGTIRFNGVDGIQTVSGLRDFYYITNLITSNMFKLFRATLSQSGTGVPTATILENTTGLVPVFSRDDVGEYGIDNVGVVNASKVVVLIQPTNGNVSKVFAGALLAGHEIFINTWGVSTAEEDGWLDNTGIDIKIYP